MKISALIPYYLFLITFSLLLIPSLFAAPAKGGGAEATAEGYPAWAGVTPKNYVAGRTLLSASDLRQRVATVVVEFDAAKASSQLEQAGEVATVLEFMPLEWESRNWESFVVPRDVIVVFVPRNLKSADEMKPVLKVKDEKKQPGIATYNRSQAPMYANLTFEGAPDAAEKLPFVYVMGYEGKEPLVQEKYAAKTTLSKIKAAIKAQRKKLDEANLKWRPFYGYVAEPKHFKDVEKALKTGKPTLEAVEAKVRKGIASRDAEVSKEAQMLYDALEQTRSEMVYQVRCEAKAAPHVAAYHIHEVVRYWPKTKQTVGEVSDKLKADGSVKPLIAIYPKIVQWSDPDFTCKNAGEAKKIVAELNKMKKMLEPLKDDAMNVTAQNGALILDGMLDELISIIPTKVPQK